MTLKCGQRCTGARRIMVPEHLVEDVQIAEKLDKLESEAKLA